MGVIKRLYIKFFHDILEWHSPDKNKPIRFDGVNLYSKCKYCGKDIIKDSQSNWF